MALHHDYPKEATIADISLTPSVYGLTNSVSDEVPSVAGIVLFGFWLIGIFAALILVFRSLLRLKDIMRSALPLQNEAVNKLYIETINKLSIKRSIPVYSTAFLKSPMTMGLFKPCIFLPIHLISDFKESEMRYILFHELQHYKHKDAVGNLLSNVAGILYWFNPLVWIAIKEFRTDREIACDAAVLARLNPDDYADYGNTLIDFAEKISLTPFPFTAGISSNARQLKTRIIHIASYRKPSNLMLLKSVAVFLGFAIFAVGLAPILSTYAYENNRYDWDSSSKNIKSENLSDYFGEFNGSFVLYDSKNDAWIVYNPDRAVLRQSPDSTYKVYDALFGLDSGRITIDDSEISWDGTDYPFDAWERSHNLKSAMQNSVNWYFQKVDEMIGIHAIEQYIRQIGYGNMNVNSSEATYWLENSLKISPIEQVELMRKLHDRDLPFRSSDISAVEDAMLVSSNGDDSSLYGKTGSGRVNGNDVNGWFIGYIVRTDRTYYFAINITADANANGNHAFEITNRILSDMGLWQ